MKDYQNRKVVRDIFLLIAMWGIIATAVCVLYQAHEQEKITTDPVSSVIENYLKD